MYATHPARYDERPKMYVKRPAMYEERRCFALSPTVVAGVCGVSALEGALRSVYRSLILLRWFGTVNEMWWGSSQAEDSGWGLQVWSTDGSIEAEAEEAHLRSNQVGVVLMSNHTTNGVANCGIMLVSHHRVGSLCAGYVYVTLLCGMADGGVMFVSCRQRSLFESSRKKLGGDLMLEVMGEEEPVMVGPSGVKSSDDQSRVWHALTSTCSGVLRGHSAL
eukprot:8074640-Pyramimonas_sp.AAC.1